MSDRSPDPIDTVIVLARDQASLYDFLKPRQEARGQTVVILDRRSAPPREAERAPAPAPAETERRTDTSSEALALMSVLGFMLLHRDGDRWVP